MNKVIVVVPTYNERENLTVLCQEVLKLDMSIDMLVVDDNSPDGTGRIADQLASEHPQIHVMHRKGKEGLGRAYVAGFRWALDEGYALVAQMDADLSHDPRYLPELIRAAEKGDVAIGSRYTRGGRVRNWPLKRLVLSYGGNLYVRAIAGIPLRDCTAGYRCYRREVLEAIGLESVLSNGYSFQIEMAYRSHRLGFGLVEVPIIFTERRAGQSKLSQGIFWESLWLPWRLKARKIRASS
ncbi:MAG: polyprenol monophosphomannose synthase [Armatimonadetes bacterium]|nr:polyprenol monophosphomannose synthase [Armatimonadota bacterium]